MIHLSCKTTIHASADALWLVISDFGAAVQYLSGIVTCTVDGEGVGALRALAHSSLSGFDPSVQALICE